MKKENTFAIFKSALGMYCGKMSYPDTALRALITCIDKLSDMYLLKVKGFCLFANDERSLIKYKFLSTYGESVPGMNELMWNPEDFIKINQVDNTISDIIPESRIDCINPTDMHIGIADDGSRIRIYLDKLKTQCFIDCGMLHNDSQFIRVSLRKDDGYDNNE